MGLRHRELSDHLGNVVATVPDRKTGVLAGGSATLYVWWVADVASLTEYYPLDADAGRVYLNTMGYAYINIKEQRVIDYHPIISIQLSIDFPVS